MGIFVVFIFAIMITPHSFSTEMQPSQHDDDIASLTSLETVPQSNHRKIIDKHLNPLIDDMKALEKDILKKKLPLSFQDVISLYEIVLKILKISAVLLPVDKQFSESRIYNDNKIKSALKNLHPSIKDELLYIVVQKRDGEMVDLLLLYGANPNLIVPHRVRFREAYGSYGEMVSITETPLDYAQTSYNKAMSKERPILEKIIASLKKHGAKTAEEVKAEQRAQKNK